MPKSTRVDCITFLVKENISHSEKIQDLGANRWEQYLLYYEIAGQVFYYVLQVTGCDGMYHLHLIFKSLRNIQRDSATAG